MKKAIKNVTIIAFIALLSISFTTINKEKKAIKVNESQVVWKGYKVTGTHEGTINIKTGFLNFEDQKLVGGEFVVDMTTINTTDLQGEYKGKLDGHLKSDDFFGVTNFPMASLVFTKVNATTDNTYNVTANLTIKGKTNPVTFTVTITGNKATTSLKIDRTIYNIRYGSASFFDNLKDKAINNEFDLIVDLQF